MRLNDFVKQSGGQRVDEYRHPPSMFDPDPENVRFDTQEVRDHIRGLANSIREEGVREPLTCREVDGRLVVINGNMRLTAVRLLLAEGDGQSCSRARILTNNSADVRASSGGVPARSAAV